MRASLPLLTAFEDVPVGLEELLIRKRSVCGSQILYSYDSALAIMSVDDVPCRASRVCCQELEHDVGNGRRRPSRDDGGAAALVDTFLDFIETRAQIVCRSLILPYVGVLPRQWREHLDEMLLNLEECLAFDGALGRVDHLVDGKWTLSRGYVRLNW